MKNPYVPTTVQVSKIIEEVDTGEIKTFQVSFLNKADEEAFTFLPGQFAQLSIYGKGEAPIGIASSPTEKGYLTFTVQRAGLVTSALHELEEGTCIGLRGPYGNSWPLEYLEGKNIVIVAGGFAFTTLRSLTIFMLHPDNRPKFGKLTVIYGARNPELLIYKDQFGIWKKKKDPETYVTVDKGNKRWKGKEGFVPAVCEEVAPCSDNAVAVICGPPIMIRFTLPIFYDLGFSKENIYTSLEMRMKCGFGKCGRCNVGSKYVCTDGPVFSLAELDSLTKEY